MKQVIWDQELIHKYSGPAPRYTSYPTAIEFNEKFSHKELFAAFHKYPEKNLSLYLHIPFCHKLCYFCGCNKIVTTHQDKADVYLDYLALEIESRASFFAAREVTQIHLGGGTPTYLTIAQSRRLMELIFGHFKVAKGAEISIEMDPREVHPEYLDHLRKVGFNRLSIGIQDFNPEVQRLINREQDEAEIFKLTAHARELGFSSISVDLIYGLPKQTLASFKKTLATTARLSPDRISVYNFAYLPDLIKANRLIHAEDIPKAKEKLALLEETVAFLVAAGYEFIGMDHFAKKGDELAKLQERGELHRNFQGYTTQGDTDLLGLGVSAISIIGDVYAQNEKILSHYYTALEKGTDALKRGFALSREDCLRRDIIKQIVCNLKVNYAHFAEEYGINFAEKFAPELSALKEHEADGLLEFTESGFVITAKGRLLIRPVAMVFDTYSQAKRKRFSRAI